MSLLSASYCISFLSAWPVLSSQEPRYSVSSLGFGVISVSLLQELRERVLRGKYRIPFYMSTDCENLLKKFLILNPSKRGTLEVSS